MQGVEVTFVADLFENDGSKPIEVQDWTWVRYFLQIFFFFFGINAMQ